MLLLKGHEVLPLAIMSALRQDIFWTLWEYYAARIRLFLVCCNQSPIEENQIWQVGNGGTPGAWKFSNRQSDIYTEYRICHAETQKKGVPYKQTSLSNFRSLWSGTSSSRRLSLSIFFLLVNGYMPSFASIFKDLWLNTIDCINYGGSSCDVILW